MVQFEGDELTLNHGSLSVVTFRGMKVRIGCVVVTPANNNSASYEVADIAGKAAVSAVKDDVYIEAPLATQHQAKKAARSSRAIVREGEQKTRGEKCSDQPAIAATRGGILNSPYVIGSSVGAIVGVACWVLCNSGEPVSPAKP
jgi:hypothetical protein